MNQPVKNDVTMIVRVVAKCTKCGCKETFYVDEQHKDPITYTCKICENDKFEIIFR